VGRRGVRGWVSVGGWVGGGGETLIRKSKHGSGVQFRSTESTSINTEINVGVGGGVGDGREIKIDKAREAART
jgi:hypothetical protein